jgi:hypothetical protein
MAKILFRDSRASQILEGTWLTLQVVSIALLWHPSEDISSIIINIVCPFVFTNKNASRREVDTNAFVNSGVVHN